MSVHTDGLPCADVLLAVVDETEEILAWSTGILSPVTVDDLGGEGADTLAGYRSLLHGRRPQVSGYGSEQAEVAALVERVEEWIAQGIRLSEIGVCARFNVLLDKAYDKLTAAGVPVVRVKDNPGPGVDGVRLATMHAMKGLEFRCVAVLGVTASAVPFAREVTPADVDALQHDFDLLRERCLLFVACTRAREALSVTWSGAVSPFVPTRCGRGLVGSWVSGRRWRGRRGPARRSRGSVRRLSWRTPRTPRGRGTPRRSGAARRCPSGGASALAVEAEWAC